MSGTRPSCTSGIEKSVPSAASRTSQQSASSIPAPMQARWMAAITGTRSVSTAENEAWWPSRCWRMRAMAWPGDMPSSAVLSVEPALTSRPAQKHPPAPISTATRTSGAASTSRHASPMPCHISLSSALSRSGLLSVMVADVALDLHLHLVGHRWLHLSRPQVRLNARTIAGRRGSFEIWADTAGRAPVRSSSPP